MNALTIVPRDVWPLTSADGIELGILCVSRYVPNRTALGMAMTAKGEGSDISLPFVSFIHGAKPA